MSFSRGEVRDDDPSALKTIRDGFWKEPRIGTSPSGVELIFYSCPQRAGIRPPKPIVWLECGILILDVGIVMTFALCLRSNQAKPVPIRLGFLFRFIAKTGWRPRKPSRQVEQWDKSETGAHTGIPPKMVYLSLFVVLLINFNHGDYVKLLPDMYGSESSPKSWKNGCATGHKSPFLTASSGTEAVLVI